MKVVEHLRRLGGVASRATLVEVTSRHAVDRAVGRGEVVRDGRGRYALPSVSAARRTAHALSAVLSHRSAAAHWGWEQKLTDLPPEVTVPRNRKVVARPEVTVHWADLSPGDVRQGVTSRRRTLADCLRSLPLDEALSIADSALRHHDVGQEELREIAAALTGPGSARARHVAALADPRSANPFESTLRAIALDVAGLALEPQVPIVLPSAGTAYVDLADRRLKIVAEADSFGWHGSRQALWRDCRRYNRLVLLGWLVLRFAWEDVMFHPDYVRECLKVAARRAQPRSERRKAA